MIKPRSFSSYFVTGPGVGAYLYEMGGFMLPFLVVGAISIFLSLTLIVTIPNLGPPEPEDVALISDPTQVQLRYFTFQLIHIHNKGVNFVNKFWRLKCQFCRSLNAKNFYFLFAIA